MTNRRGRAIVAALSGLGILFALTPLLYLLSVGPALYLMDAGYISYFTIESLYSPLVRFAESWSPLNEFLGWYVYLWRG
jgi:subtilase family serine protease